MPTSFCGTNRWHSRTATTAPFVASVCYRLRGQHLWSRQEMVWTLNLCQRYDYSWRTLAILNSCALIENIFAKIVHSHARHWRPLVQFVSLHCKNVRIKPYIKVQGLTPTYIALKTKPTDTSNDLVRAPWKSFEALELNDPCENSQPIGKASQQPCCGTDRRGAHVSQLWWEAKAMPRFCHIWSCCDE